MRASLAEQLVGLVGLAQLSVVEGKKQAEAGRIFGLQRKMSVSKNRDTANFQRLRDCETVVEFKMVARSLLLVDIGNIHEIKQTVHGMFRDRPKIQGKLIWLFLTIRDGLGRIRPEFHRTFLNRCLTKTEPRTDIPKEWLI